MSNARILVADDHELIRRGIISALAERPEWTIVAEASDGRQACELAAQHAPDIAVLDLSMPERNGLDVTRELRTSTPKTRILIVTAHESEQLIREVLDAGAMGYVLKSDAGRVIVQAVDALLDERPFFTTKIARFVLDGYLRTSGNSGPPSAAVALSPRERHIVQLLAEGKNNKEVARSLHLSVKTVETHRSNIMRKMEFRSLADLIRYAIRNKIVEA
jgi:DNA-binding NarL/FixJ family response regulator